MSRIEETLIPTIINQQVDALKYHAYPQGLDEAEMIDYNDFVTDLIHQKKAVQKQVNDYKDERFFQIEIGKKRFQLMATTTKGFAVTLKNNDISMSLRRFKDNSLKQPCLKVEFRAEYLTRYGYLKCTQQFEEYLKEFLPSYILKVSEIHLATDIQNYNFTFWDFFRMKSRARSKNFFTEDSDDNNTSNTFFESNNLTSINLGKGSLMLRIYNKTIEIKKFKQKAFIEPMKWMCSPNYDPNKTTWRIEGQIRREQLKKLVSDKGVLDNHIATLNSIPSIWKHFVTKFVHKDLSRDECIMLIEKERTLKNGKTRQLSPNALRKIINKAPSSVLWNMLGTFFQREGRTLTKHEELSLPSKQYVANSFSSLISTFTKLNRGSFDSFALVELLKEENEKKKDKNGFSILDEAKIKTLDWFNEAKIYIEENGIAQDTFRHYEKDLTQNLLDMFLTFEETPKPQLLEALEERL